MVRLGDVCGLRGEEASQKNSGMLELLKTRFGYDAFLPLQEEIHAIRIGAL